uniref:Uncharacterized protein n=1 Tax=Cacopsylla melanoneura TaxID=428564 RepID=A0A8D8QLN5_9HEMI
MLYSRGFPVRKCSNCYSSGWECLLCRRFRLWRRETVLTVWDGSEIQHTPGQGSISSCRVHPVYSNQTHPLQELSHCQNQLSHCLNPSSHCLNRSSHCQIHQLVLCLLRGLGENTGQCLL